MQKIHKDCIYLNAILLYLSKSQNDCIDMSEIARYLYSQWAFIKNLRTAFEISNYVDILIEDGYLNLIDIEGSHSLILKREGKEFIENGGYRKPTCLGFFLFWLKDGKSYNNLKWLIGVIVSFLTGTGIGVISSPFWKHLYHCFIH
jgi:hypothetical protein